LRHAKEIENEKKILMKQQQIIEKAFVDFNGDQDEISIQLDEKLRSELVNQLFEKGYNVYQRSVYDSQNPRKTVNGELKLPQKATSRFLCSTYVSSPTVYITIQ